MKQLTWKFVLFAVLFFIVLKGIDFFGARGMTSTSLTVAENAVAEYEMAMRNGDKATACFRAGVAASAYLSAKAEADYRKWHAIYKACS